MYRAPRWLTSLSASLYMSPWTAIALVTILGGIGALNHSMWRDEMNVWLIARDSPTWAALVENIHYDRAHPGLWHLCVAALQAIFGHPVAMQLFHWLLALGSGVLLWRYSPFTQLQKWLFTFGYLPFYEHLLIARNYAIAMLLLFAVCAAWPQRRRAYWPLAILIALLANTNVYALLMAIALALTLLLELACEGLGDRKVSHSWLDVVGSGGLLLLGCGVALYFILPPSDVADQALGDYVLGFDFHYLLRAIGRVFAGYFTVIPNAQRYFDLILCAAISLIALGLTSLQLVKKPYALGFYWLGTSVMLGFTYFKFMANFIRHYGNFYLVLIAALWLAHHYTASPAIIQRLPILHQWQGRSRRWFTRLFTAMLVVHLAGGIYGFTLDLIVPYSASRAAAAYLRQPPLQDAFIVASRDAQMAALSGYAGRKFYYPEREAIGSYTLFFKGSRREVAEPEVLQQVTQLLATHPKILLILTTELAAPPPTVDIEPLETFTRAQTNEKYYFYWVSR